MAAARIAIYTIALNEAQFVDRWAESCKEADVRIILDTGSNDDTVSRARALGITVHSANIKPWRFDDARNAALALLPPDIDLCVSLDMDEILLPGWREEIEKAQTAGATRVSYNYAWTVNALGVPAHIFRTDKIHARFGYRWKHPIHEIITSTGNEQRQESAIWIHHLADNSKPRAQYLPLLEMAARESPECSRTLFYLAREYTFHERQSDAAKVFEKYLTCSTWSVERAHACLHLSKCQPDRRLEWLHHALTETPQRREVMLALCQYYSETKKWEMASAIAMSALKITERPTDYLCQPEAWSWLPFDLAATAAYWLGLQNFAIELGEKAIALNPNDERLLRNMGFYKAA
jgi:tetratricopeptide (TPR) repeat protein